MKHDYYLEQPEVNFRHEFILLTYGKDGDNLLGYSTYTKFNKLLGGSLRISTVMSTEYDKNHDGKMDYISLTVRLPLLPTEIVHKVQMLLFFNYRLHQFSSLLMQSMAYIHSESSLAGSTLVTEGDLKFHQKLRLPNRGSFLKYNVSIINATSNDIATWNLENIMSTYHARNVSTDFISRYPIWKSGKTNGKPFTIKVKIHYPEETILYQPGFWRIIKVAWIQYLAVLFIFLVVSWKIQKFVYTNRLVNVFK